MNKATRKPHCRLTSFGEAVLSFPYSAALVQALKDSIPFRYREYNPSTKEWTVQPEFADYATALLLEHFPNAEIPPREQWRRRQAESWTDGDDRFFRVLHLRPTAQRELIDGAYRILALRLHPDHGGDVTEMQQLNGAYAALKERVGA
jgi:hypothetical protein